MGPILQTTPMGSVIAAALVVAGAPLFGSGLRSLRLRRALRALKPLSATAEDGGFGMIHGRVSLESPLVGPISRQPCAGYRLEVRGPGGMCVSTVDDFRPFRLAIDGAVAHVAGGEGRWDLSPIAEREVAAGDAVSENLAALLARSPEALWLRRCGMTVTLVERALLAGDECCVIGSVRHARPFERVHDLELARTGTDDARAHPRPYPVVPALSIEADPSLDFLHISDRTPTAEALAVPAWRALGVLAGPLLGVLGMLYLAALADALRATRVLP
jgi:hypothetical protein